MHLSGADAMISRERAQHLMAGLGALGFLAYLGVFVVTELVQGPTPLLVIAAVAVYGPVWGTLASYAGMLLSTNVFFLFARAVGGKALTQVAHPRVQAMLAAIERHPVRAVIVSRAVLWPLPGIGYGLALSGLRFRDHFLGSLLALWSPCILCALFGETVMALVH